MIIKLVEAKNSDFSSSIVKASNRQTPVTNEAFEILRDFHKNLEEAYAAYPSDFRLYYERRSKQYDSADICRGKIVTLSVQVFSYVAMFLAEPQSTHRYYGELLDSNKNRIFREGDIYNQYCISALFLFFAEQWLKRHRKEFIKYKYHIILLLRCLIDSNPVPPRNSKKMESLCDRLFEALKDENRFSGNMAKAVSIIEQGVSRAAQKVDDTNLARSKEFTSILLDLCGHASDDNISTPKPLAEGDVVNCTVRAMNWCFAYVDIDGCAARGQIHISELSDKYTYSISERVSIGDHLRARIITNEQHPEYGYYLSLRNVAK